MPIILLTKFFYYLSPIASFFFLISYSPDFLISQKNDILFCIRSLAHICCQQSTGIVHSLEPSVLRVMMLVSFNYYFMFNYMFLIVIYKDIILFLWSGTGLLISVKVMSSLDSGSIERQDRCLGAYRRCFCFCFCFLSTLPLSS